MFRLAGVAALMAGAAEAYNGGGGGGGNPLEALTGFGQKPGDVGQYYECTQATYKVGDATKR